MLRTLSVLFPAFLKNNYLLFVVELQFIIKMPQSKKDLKKLKQKQNAEQGIVYQKKPDEKFIKCSVCRV
jgi:hypothetical protein